MATPPAADVLLTVEEAARRLNIGRLRRVPVECLDNFVATLRSSSQPETVAA